MIIAEIGQAHDGSLGILHTYIDALAGSGINAIKFQTHIAAAESSEYEPFRIPFSYEDVTRYDYWKRMEFTPEQWKGIKQHCEDKGLEFISSPFSNAAVDLLEQLGVLRYKVGSGEVANRLLLQKIAYTQKPVILSSGLSTYYELDEAVALLEKAGVADISLLQCITAYPALPQQWGLHNIAEIKKRYNKKTGFSDHSGNIYACLAAAVSGAEIFEFHVTFHKQLFGPDTVASILVDDVPALTEGIRQIQTALQNKNDKNDLQDRTHLKNIFEKSLAVNQSLPAGTVLAFNHLEAKKPSGYGIPAGSYQSVLGRRLGIAKQQWDFLKEEDLKPA